MPLLTEQNFSLIDRGERSFSIKPLKHAISITVSNTRDRV